MFRLGLENTTSPLLGEVSPSKILIKVLFPDPLPPLM
jgi:hypothetical protein